MPVGIRHLIPVGILVSFLRMGNANERVEWAIPWLQMADDPTLGHVLIGVVTAVQVVLLSITGDRFIRMIVRASLGQAGPSQPRSPRFGRVCLALVGYAGYRSHGSDVTSAIPHLVESRRSG